MFTKNIYFQRSGRGLFTLAPSSNHLEVSDISRIILRQGVPMNPSKDTHRSAFVVILSIFILVHSGCEQASSSASGESDSHTTHESTATESSTGDEDTAGATDSAQDAETWIDAARGLEWQNPSREQTSLFPGAKTYCSNLVLAGKDDWRLPTLNEARTLLEGVSPTMEGGFCPASEECLDWMNCSANAKYESACQGCLAVGGKHLVDGDCDRNIEAGECYWRAGLQGTCASYWTTTKTGIPTGRYSVGYSQGYIRAGVESASAQSTRCVRDL
jgi:hypothetical protein